MIMPRALRPVSYTHLDVYKRQGESGPAPGLTAGEHERQACRGRKQSGEAETARSRRHGDCGQLHARRPAWAARGGKLPFEAHTAQRTGRPARHRGLSFDHPRRLSVRSAIVIGAGIGGLALAIRLQSAGVAVDLVEARDRPGGRAYVWERDGFTFDAGPTVITDPACLAELWRLTGADMAADVTLLSLIHI